MPATNTNSNGEEGAGVASGSSSPQTSIFVQQDGGANGGPGTGWMNAAG